jgi:flagella basal body P-ring formation protein FlgA
MDRAPSPSGGLLRALGPGWRVALACLLLWAGLLAAPAATAGAAAAAVTTATPATPATPTGLPAAAVAAAARLAEQAARATAPDGARIVATPGALDARLRLAPCDRVEPLLVPGQPAWGRTRIALRCTAGTVAWRVFLPVEVQVLAPALVSRGPLPAGVRLEADQFHVAQVDWGAAAEPPLADIQQLTGRTLARALAAGQPARRGDLQSRQWFASGETVRVVAIGPGYSVSTEGQALGGGIEGQPVRVRTESGRVLVGRPVGAHRVEVAL